MIELAHADNAAFAWLRGAGAAPAGVDRICPDGLAPPEVMEIVDQMAARVRGEYARPSAWLVVAQGEAVGLISFKGPPDSEGFVDIGYGIGGSREGRGLATGAVAALIALARAEGLNGLTAETATDNRASQIVLERNGFVPTGERDDPEDGRVIGWRRTFE